MLVHFGSFVLRVETVPCFCPKTMMRAIRYLLYAVYFDSRSGGGVLLRACPEKKTANCYLAPTWFYRSA